MALTSKEILVITDKNMYVIQKPDGSYGLTNKENATMFNGTRAAKAAIRWCRKYVYIGDYRYEKQRRKNNYFLLDSVSHCGIMLADGVL